MKKAVNGNPSFQSETDANHRRTLKPDERKSIPLRPKSIPLRPKSTSNAAGIKISRPEQRKLAEQQWVPPDGGWGWFCVFSCFLTFFLFVGTSRTFGVIYNDVREAFPDARHIQIAMIPSMVVTLTIGFSVVAGALTAAFSCRKVAFVGGLLGGSGLSLSYFTMNVHYMQFMFFITGIGASLACTPGILIVAKYFRKRRAQAMGFALSGTAIGAMILPLFIRFLADTYGFRGALLIQGGLLFHTCAGAMLYREAVHPKPKPKPQPRPQPKPIRQRSITQRSTTERSITSESPALLLEGKAMSHEPKGQSTVNVRRSADHTPLMKQTSVTVTSSNVDPPEGQYADERQERSNCCFRFVYKYLYLDLTLFHNSVFLVMLLATFTLTIAYPQALIFFPPYAEALGHSPYTAGFLLSISSLGDLIGRLLNGWLFDKGIVDKQTGFIICATMMSLGLIGSGAYPNYFWIAVCVFVYGYFAGGSFILIPVLLSEHFGLSKLSSSVGIVRTFQGVTSFIGPPLAGHIRDETDSFQYSLIILGTMSLSSPIFMLLMIPVKRRYRRRREMLDSQ